MHTILKFFDFSANGNFGNFDKAAVRFSAEREAVNSRTSSDFLKIMGAMMALDPQQVQASLDQFAKVPWKGDAAGGYAPLIDLSGEEDHQPDILELLMGRTVAHQAPADGNDQDQAGEDCCPCSDPAGSAQVAGDQNAARIILSLPGLIADPAQQGISIEPQVQLQPSPKAPATADCGTGPNPVFDPRQLKQPAQANPEDGASSAGADKKIVVDTATRHPMAEHSGRRPDEKGPPIPPAVKSAQTIADPGAKTEAGVQAAVTGAQRTLKPVPENPVHAKPPPEPDGRQAAAQDIRPARGERAGRVVEPAWQTGHGFNSQAEAAKGGFEDSETIPRMLAGREGQGMMTHQSSKTAGIADHIPADRAGSEPAREMQTDVMRQIVKRMTLHTQGSQSKMQIQLKPEFLGHVHMQISTDNRQVVVRMTAESVAVKEMIEQRLVFLRAELQQHGLEIDKFDVHVRNDSEGWKNSQDPSGFRQALKNGQQEQMGRQKRERSGSRAFAANEAKQQSQNDSSEIDYFA